MIQRARAKTHSHNSAWPAVAPEGLARGPLLTSDGVDWPNKSLNFACAARRCFPTIFQVHESPYHLVVWFLGNLPKLHGETREVSSRLTWDLKAVSGPSGFRPCRFLAFSRKHKPQTDKIQGIEQNRTFRPRRKVDQT